MLIGGGAFSSTLKYPEGPFGYHGGLNGDKKIPLNTVRQCEMGVPLYEALNMNGSLYLTVGYLIRMD